MAELEKKFHSDKMPLHELAFAEGETTFATFDNKLQRNLYT